MNYFVNCFVNETRLIQLVVSDSCNTAGYSTEPAADLPVWEPVECSRLDENKPKHDGEGSADWGAGWEVLQNLG